MVFLRPVDFLRAGLRRAVVFLRPVLFLRAAGFLRAVVFFRPVDLRAVLFLRAVDLRAAGFRVDLRAVDLRLPVVFLAAKLHTSCLYLHEIYPDLMSPIVERATQTRVQRVIRHHLVTTCKHSLNFFPCRVRRRARDSRGCAQLACSAFTTQTSSLAFGSSAPDTELFLVIERVFETLHPYFALIADGARGFG